MHSLDSAHVAYNGSVGTSGSRLPLLVPGLPPQSADAATIRYDWLRASVFAHQVWSLASA
jgi:hypothetical protein